MELLQRIRVTIKILTKHSYKTVKEKVTSALSQSDFERFTECV